jgi:hypothetical protein
MDADILVIQNKDSAKKETAAGRSAMGRPPTQYDFECSSATRSVRWRSPMHDRWMRRGDCADCAPRSTVRCGDASIVAEPLGAKLV